MSFPRAKLTRFNENTPCTPSPADYNVNIKSNITCPKFTEPKSHSDSGSAVSVSSTPCFRTPTLMRKKKVCTSKSDKNKTELFKDGPFDEKEDQTGKISHADREVFIKDLLQQIEDMKEQLGVLETNNFDILEQKNKLLEKIKDLKEEQQVTLQNIYLEHDNELKKNKDEIDQLEFKLLVAQEDHNQQLRDNETLNIETGKIISELQSKINILLAEKEELIKANEKLREDFTQKLEEEKNKYLEELKELVNEHKKSIDDLELKASENLLLLKESSEKEKKKLLHDVNEKCKKILKESEDKIKQVEENSKEANLLIEMQMQEKCNDIEQQWQLKLEKKEKDSEAILKECQAIGEYSIIQCELEKQTIQVELEKNLNKLEVLEKTNAELITSLKELEIKHKDLEDDKRGVFKIEVETLKKELLEVNNQKKMYEISINKTHETIQTLKKRLLDSDHDVEQLKSELDLCEKEKLDMYTKCTQLNEDLKVLNGLNEDLELQFENMQKSVQTEIENIQVSLFCKLEEYELEAKNNIAALEKDIKNKEWLLQEAQTQLEKQQFLRESAQKLITSAELEIQEGETRISELETENKKCVIKITQLEDKVETKETENYVLSTELKVALGDKCKLIEEVNKLKINEQELIKENNVLQEKSDSYLKYCDYYKAKAAEYENEVEDLSTVNKKYIEQSGKYDKLLQEFEAMKILNEQYQKMIDDQELLIGPFRQQLEEYEMERRALLDQKSEAEMEAKNMGLKYASLLGHQNQKQKIKHLIDLKAKNYELLESNKELELKVKTQSKTIDKLKKELSTITLSPRKSKMPNAEKENVHSPNRILNNRVESPNRYLRDRNN